MNRLFDERPLLKTGILGILILPFLVLINEFSPSGEKIPEGYSSTILAFEFVSDKNELLEVLCPLGIDELEDLDRLNFVDFGFMIMYGIFLFLFMARLGQMRQDLWLQRGRWLVPVIVLCDAIENVQLLKLTDCFASETYEVMNDYFLLQLFTWSKWLLLGGAFAIVGFRLTTMIKSKWTGLILFIPLILGVLAFFLDERRLEDFFATTIFLGFLLVFIYCFLYHRKMTV